MMLRGESDTEKGEVGRRTREKHSLRGHYIALIDNSTKLYHKKDPICLHGIPQNIDVTLMFHEQTAIRTTLVA